MRKRLALVICLLIMSLFSFVGCKEEPYADMKVSVVGVDSDTVQQLLIEREVQGSGQISYTYPTIDFTVKVENYGEADPKVKISGWEGYINEPQLTYLGDGLTQVTSQVISYDTTGKFTLSIITYEGNKSTDLKYEVDLKLDDFNVNGERLKAVSNSYEICLDDIGGLVTYYPENSTQKDISYSVAVPRTPYGEGYSIDGKWADEDAAYFMEEAVFEYLDNGYKYAEVKVDKDTGRQILKVYPYLINSVGEIALDGEGNPVSSVFPSIIDETIKDEEIYLDCITLMAKSEALDTPRFIDIEVVATAGDAVLQMNSQISEDPIDINRDKNDEYNIVLVDPDFKGGVVSAGEMSYYTERHLLFYVENLLSDSGESLKEYYVVADNVSANDEKAVDISMIGEHNQFKVHALSEGKYTHKFTIKHSKYPGIFDEEIVVNFKVIKMPFNINVNGYDLEIGSSTTILSSVYNVYPRGSYGSKFKVNTLSDFEYFLYLSAEDPNFKLMVDNLVLRRDGDGETAVFASMAGAEDGSSSIGSTVEGVDYTRFKSSSTFFLSHHFETLPTEYLVVYIGISFAVSDASYSEDVASNFLDLTLIYPILLNIENGIDKINFTQDAYKVNLSNNLLEYEEDAEGNVLNYDSGIKLWDLPAGKTYENSIKSITYNEELIKVYPIYDEVTQITSLYIKYVKNAPVGETEIVLETLNQLVRSVKVDTYIPTIYQYNGDLIGESAKMPLSIGIDKDSSAFLYYMSGASDVNVTAKWEVFVSEETGSGYYYDSVKRLFMITNATQNVKFYDYQVKLVNGSQTIIPIDITDRVTATFSYPNYARFEDGVITTNSLITYNIEAPIIMTVTYSAGYEYYDESGALVYDTYTMVHTIDLFIYDQLQGVEVLTAKSVNLFVEDSLGYYDKDLASHTIVSTYIPNEIKLGAAWNDSPVFQVLNLQPVTLWYEYQDLLESNIIGDDGQEIKIKSIVTGEYRTIKYKDLFAKVSDDNYELTIKSVISYYKTTGKETTEELKEIEANYLYNWFENNGYGDADSIERCLRENIFSNNIQFMVNVYINQFDRLQNVNQIKFTSRYATKTSGLKLDVQDDGVYFEVRKNSDGDWELSDDKIIVEYTINTPGSIGSELILSNEETLFYSAEVVADSTGTSGRIIITPKLNKGVGYLVVTPKDNIIGVDPDTRKPIYYNSNAVLSFRIKVADGSKGYEFEIASADDYQRLYDTTKAGYYYHYIISRDINLKGYNVCGLNIPNNGNQEFSLSGKHAYFKNDNEIVKYNSIYNVEIEATVHYPSGSFTAGSPLNYGLFGYLEQCVTLDNVFIKNSKIVITEHFENDRDINIGILVGYSNGATINSCSIVGSIKVARNIDSADIYVGGLAGYITGNTEISNLPGNYSTGVVSTGNNAYVDIEVTGAESIVNYITSIKTIVGGLVGVATGSDINKQQVISNITTTIRSSIGGVVGGIIGVNAVNITNIDVSPKIVANLTSTADANNIGLNIGSVIGIAKSEYAINNTIVNYVDIGTDGNYTWQDRANIIVIASSEKVSVGGIVGTNSDSSGKSGITTTYVRSYYKRVIDENYAGNVYIIANENSSVGGIIGVSTDRFNIVKSYFDANISAFEGIKNIGMLIGSLPSSSSIVANSSYAIGLMYDISLIDAGEEVVTTLAPNTDKNRLVVGTVGKTWNSGGDYYTNNYANTNYLELTNFVVTNVYVVVNEKETFFLDNSKIYYIDNLTEMLNTGTSVDIDDFFEGNLSYSLTRGNVPLEGKSWFWHNEVNTTKVGNTTYAFPVILNGNMVMYDLVPTKIEVVFNERTGLYNVSYTTDEIVTNQIIMYINRDKDGQVANDCYYEMSLDNVNSEFVISLKGGVTINTTYVNMNNLKVNDKIEFVESSEGAIIEIIGNRIYPVSTGSVTLTIRSYVAKSIKAVITIEVVDGITEFDFIYNDTKVLEEVQYTIQNDKIITNNTVYVDELSEFNLLTYNILNDYNYLPNESIGFILEICDASEGGLYENGIIKINGREFTFNPELVDENGELNNVYVFNTRSFKVSGVYIGEIRFKVTPYINLSSVVYTDSYVSEATDDESQPVKLSVENVYILDGKTGDGSNLQKEYELSVRARAKGVTTSVKNVGIDATNKVAFNVILETANVKVYDNGDDSYTIVILEDILVQINNKKFNAPLTLTKGSFIAKLVNGKYVCKNFESFSGKAFDYTLINIIFESLTIAKTNVDPLSRNNTYKLTFGATISFDRDFYRLNANKYDLNTASFNISFVPDSNPSVVESPQMLTTIVPSEIQTIFTNFYSKGVDKLDESDYEQEYPEYNDSSFIVPGRDGLLKITTDEEFNNSSYMTLSLSKDYLGYVTLQQLAGLVDRDYVDGVVPDIIGYDNVTSLEYFETATTFGVKLSKLSLNYIDNHYFSNTYYVKVLAVKDISVPFVNMQIASYKVDRNNNKTLQLTHNVALQVMELPQLKVTVDGDDYAVMGKGVVKELEIFYKGLTNDISFLSPYETTSDKKNLDSTIDYMYIADEDGNRVVGKLSLDYLNNGGKYYLYQDVKTASGSVWAINFNAQETILGAIEESKSNLTINTVDFEIDTIDVCGVTTSNGGSMQLNLLHGQTTVFDVKFKIKDIVIGTSADIENHTNYLYGEKGPVTINEYAFAGTLFKEVASSGESVYSEGTSYLQERTQDGNQVVYTDISVNYPDTLRVGGITLSRNPRQNDSLYYLYYEISGTTIGDNTFIRLDVDYYFNSDGKMTVGSDSMYVFPYYVDIQIIINDNSTYDHPTPIETQEDLLRACSVEGGNFILLNNITLVNWAPQEALFDTLDGNSYVITIESFDFSEVWGSKSANVGIFSTISEETMLKNITVDVQHLLKTEIDMLNDISAMRASSQSTYKHTTEKIDLGYIEELNFGVLAGVNQGAITNARIISRTSSVERVYLHVLTTLGYIDDNLVVSNIGGIVGHNDTTGAISNSFVGVSINGVKGSEYYIEAIDDASPEKLINLTDTLVDIQIYPFVLAGGNNIAGISSINDGVISNTYAKGLGIYNAFPSVGNSATAGLVVKNNNLITSTFVEGNEIVGYRAEANKFMIESTGYIGGLVYENNGTIENSYTNAYLQTLSSFLGGFVYINNEDGYIKNAYSTAVNRNSLATGQFTGVKQGVLQNFGTYENCYYLVEDEQFENINESAQAIIESINSFDETSSWSGFSFVSGVNVDGIWNLEKGKTPRIQTTLTDTVSFRRLSEVEYNEANGGTIYNYTYNTYYLGTKENPLLIDKEENFDKYIIDSSFDYGTGSKIFGYSSSDYAVRFVRVVNNLNFEEITTAKEYDGTYLYKVVFAGVLDGNGMTLANLNINTDNTGLDNFGLFAQIGYEKSTTKAVVKNFTMTIRTYKSTGNTRAGMLAGTIVNASVVNIKLNGNNQTISAINAAGALAGAVYSTNGVVITLSDIVVEDVIVEATYSSLRGTLNSRSEDLGVFFKSFTVESEGTQTSKDDPHQFESLYDSEKHATVLTEEQGGKLIDRTKLVSYAGTVAGFVIANNSTIDMAVDKNINDYRTKAEQSTINNIVVKGDIVVSTADNSGGLFGYIGENTLVRNSKLVVSDNQLLKGFNNIGGIVGENHGIIEQCSVEYDAETQVEYDALLTENEAKNGTFNLFDMGTGEPYYVVSIGGIAGKSENGIIIDSYTTINVIKSLSYIAGGIVGYAEGYNYLGYVYNTGAVLGLYVIGGIVGFQVNDYIQVEGISNTNNPLVMENVISLTNWNEYNESLNVRNIITARLFDNYKLMYANSGSYYNFYFKIPEVGNAPINYLSEIDVNGDGEVGDADDIKKAFDIEEMYRTSHTNYYIGSVVGKTMLRNDNNIKNSDYDPTETRPTETNSHIIYSNNLLSRLYDDSNNVFSSTLGLVTTTGDIESGSREDNYFKISFVVEGGQDLDINSLSYRVANRNSELNGYELINASAETGNNYIDRFDFNQVFTAQEYRQQILGKSYTGVAFDAETGAIIACKSTKNIFNSGYNVNRHTVGNAGQFIDDKLIWGMQYFTDNSESKKIGYRPIFANGLTPGRETITSSEALSKAFISSSSGKAYEITEDITLDVYNVDKDKFINYYGSIKSMFIGAKGEDKTGKATITINMPLEYASKSNNLATIFNIWSGATFDNIKFVINVQKDVYTGLEVNEVNYGILANTIDGAYLVNCDFEINVEYLFEVNAIGVDTVASQHAYYGENVGVLFGSVVNSDIVNCSFKVNANNIKVNNNIINNVGLVAGKISGSNIVNSRFELVTKSSDKNINVEVVESADTLNIGGIAGTILSSRYSNNELIWSESYNNLIKVNDKYNNSIKNIAAMFGYASQLNFAGFADNDKNKVMSINYIANNELDLNELNVASVVGKANATRIDSFVVANKENDSRSVYTINVSNNGRSDVFVEKCLSIGSMIGYDNGSSQIGRSGAVGSYIDITSNIDSYSANIGGLIGYTKGSNQLVTNGFYDGKIEVINTGEGKREVKVVDGKDIVTLIYAETNVGGIVGALDGYSVLNSVVFAGNITVTTVANDIEYASSSIGGIVGIANNNSKIDNFASIGLINVPRKDTHNETNGFVYISGIIGYNKGIFTGSYGYSYIDLPKKTNAEVSAVTNGMVSVVDESVFYTQEFLGNNYNNDNKFIGFAMGDLHGTVSKYSNIYKLVDSNAFAIKQGNEVLVLEGVESIGTVQLFVPSTLKGLICSETKSFDKFNPNVISSSITNPTLPKTYNVIINNLTNETINTIPAGYVVSGKTLDNGYKVEIYIENSGSSTSSTKYFVTNNNGVLSNVYLKLGQSSEGSQEINDVALTSTNNGLITNCYVYGLTSCNYVFALNNNGKIYSSASAAKYVKTKTNDIYNYLFAFVQTNNEDAVISDCYSSSFGYTESDRTKYITKVAMVHSNDGTIQNSAYYLPEEMAYDNELIGFNNPNNVDDNVNKGEILSCYVGELPKNLLNRKTKFYEENSHIQILGFKDVSGAIVIRLYISTDNGANWNEISSVKQLQEDISTYTTSDNVNDNKPNYTLKYEYDFYVSEDKMPVYNVVRICNSYDFESYINGLTGGYISENTIVMFTNNLSKSTNSYRIQIDPTRLNEINVSKGAAIIGINTSTIESEKDKNIILDFSKSYDSSKGTYEQQSMLHSFIKDNRGVLTGFDIHNIIFSTISENATLAFAPIITNSGVINNVNLENVFVTSAVRSHVAGLVARNEEGAKIKNCIISGLSLSSRRYVNFICTSNVGFICLETVKCTSSSIKGNIYIQGV